ncbi:hypothetical protein LL033_17315 [Clostridium estertheticum]|uniref:hypothetical protein n=1 Tax=Clostridium estertheticum TaxID=238834 RepID=UPI001C0ACE58|nr:hypothetical protein [Clostridium estertheticum]MBU3216671.1 hypothetical protein [Clostridium estertheticum]WAG54373.1 hypothetical protein LL033_17315 [Clostridium estertheticum]
MRKQILPKSPRIKDFMGMNIINGIVYHREAFKRAQNAEKKEFHLKRFNELKIELENYKAA